MNCSEHPDPIEIAEAVRTRCAKVGIALPETYGGGGQGIASFDAPGLPFSAGRTP